jgi:hypothetical protein
VKPGILAVLSPLMIDACAGRSPVNGVSPETARCAALSDSVSKYVSADALPLAHLVGNPMLLHAPTGLGARDSVYVDFVVLPTGLADASTILISGTTDPEFARSVSAFAAQSRFAPAQMQGCSILSRYNLVVRPQPATSP